MQERKKERKKERAREREMESLGIAKNNRIRFLSIRVTGRYRGAIVLFLRAPWRLETSVSISFTVTDTFPNRNRTILDRT